MAQQNLSINQLFESRTIQRLTSGFRINSSGDDAAGLAVANQYRADIAELTQGVQNASNGLTQLQIVDGGLNNVSQMLDRMKTLAAESASGTFTGDRSTLNTEYQKLIMEITRQASNINLNAGGSFNTNLNVYIGGGRTSNQAGSTQVNVDLSGSSNAVDAVSLGLSSSSVLGGGTSFSGNTVNNLNNPNALFNIGASGAETFAITYKDASGAVQTQTVSVTGTAGGVSGTAFVNSLNSAIATNATAIPGVTAQIGSDGSLQFSGGNLLQVVAGTSGTAPTSLATDGTSLINSANYSSAAAFTAFAAGTGTGATDTTETLVFTAGGTNYNVTLTSDATNLSQRADTLAHAVTSLNTQLAGSGITAFADNASGISFENSATFTVSETANTPGAGATTAGTGSLYGTTVGAQTVTAPSPSSSATGNALTAITAIDSAVGALGLVQGKVGTGENTLQYAIQLAQSQISSFSGAQSSIRDADVAAEAANLSKSQVLAQASVAALVQANAMPQAVLALLKG
jgi:flagellin